MAKAEGIPEGEEKRVNLVETAAADDEEVIEAYVEKVLASSSSMDNLPGLTITPSPNSTHQPHPVSSNLAILPEPTGPTLLPVLLATG